MDCSIACREFAGRIEISIGEMSAIGVIQYYTDFERTVTYTETDHDPFGLASRAPNPWATWKAGAFGRVLLPPRWFDSP